MAGGKKKKIIEKLRYRLRLVLINDENFEEKFSLKLTPINVFAVFSSFVVAFTILIILGIFYTPLREFAPGYADTKTKRNIEQLLYKTDSLQKTLLAKEKYYKNIINIVNGGHGLDDSIEQVESTSPDKKTRQSYEKDQAFRQKFEDQLVQDKHTVKQQLSVSDNSMAKLFLMKPVQGYLSNRYNIAENHFAIDIVTSADEPVKAVQEGTVILATWTPETGNTMAIQHKNNIISIYKHNSALLKKVGTFVNAGDAVAIVGNTGELSSGPHLHFELWEDGNPVNPEEFLTFN